MYQFIDFGKLVAKFNRVFLTEKHLLTTDLSFSTSPCHFAAIVFILFLTATNTIFPVTLAFLIPS